MLKIYNSDYNTEMTNNQGNARDALEIRVMFDYYDVKLLSVVGVHRVLFQSFLGFFGMLDVWCQWFLRFSGF